MNAKKNPDFVEKNSQLRISKKMMPIELFEFLERFMMGTFLINLTQLKKTGSTGKVFILLKIYKLNSIFETKNCSQFFEECYFRPFKQINFN